MLNYISCTGRLINALVQTERGSHGLSEVIHYYRQLRLSQMSSVGIPLASRRFNRRALVSETQRSAESGESGASQVPRSVETDPSFVLQS